MRRGKLAKKDRKDRAEERQVERLSRTAEEQIALLDARLGKGVGATKERNRLLTASRPGSNTTSSKSPTTKSQRRKEKAKRHEARRESGN